MYFRHLISKIFFLFLIKYDAAENSTTEISSTAQLLLDYEKVLILSPQEKLHCIAFGFKPLDDFNLLCSHCNHVVYILPLSHPFLQHREKAPDCTQIRSFLFINMDTDVYFMRYKNIRKYTFQMWRKPYLNIDDLVDKGYYYTSYEDLIRCSGCGYGSYNYQEGNQLYDYHIGSKFYCKNMLYNNFDIDNILIYNKNKFIVACVINGIEFVVKKYDPICFTPYELNRKIACLKDLRMINNKIQYEERLETFSKIDRSCEKWHLFSMFAAANLYLVEDSVLKCAYCDWSRIGWKSSDHILETHLLNSQTCVYMRKYFSVWQEIRSNAFYMNSCKQYKERTYSELVLQILKNDRVKIYYIEKGYHKIFIAETLKREIQSGRNVVEIIENFEEILKNACTIENYVPSEAILFKKAPISFEISSNEYDISNLMDNIVTKGPYEKSCALEFISNLQEGIDFFTQKVFPVRFQKGLICNVCLSQHRAVMFLPCGHYCACKQCADKLHSCGICRKIIRGTIKLDYKVFEHIANTNLKCAWCHYTKPEIIFLPCRHLIACENCEIEKKVTGDNCKICGILINGTTRIFY